VDCSPTRSDQASSFLVILPGQCFLFQVEPDICIVVSLIAKPYTVNLSSQSLFLSYQN